MMAMFIDVVKLLTMLGAGLYMVFGVCEAYEMYQRKEYIKSLFFVVFACVCALMIAGVAKL